jgi:ubiquitin carboxyl-terminal hydrolase 34
MVNGEEDVNTRISVESSTDGLSTIPVETPISSPSAIGSPEIELVTLNDEDDYSSHSPPVAIINDIDLVEDAMLSFPYFEGHLNLEQTLAKVIRYVQYGIFVPYKFPGTSTNICRGT